MIEVAAQGVMVEVAEGGWSWSRWLGEGYGRAGGAGAACVHDGELDVSAVRRLVLGLYPGPLARAHRLHLQPTLLASMHAPPHEHASGLGRRG